MYFFKRKGRQILDLRGDLVLTHNSDLVRGRVKSAAPANVANAKYVPAIPSMSPWGKLKTTWVAVRFIWGRSQALEAASIEADGI